MNLFVIWVYINAFLHNINTYLLNSCQLKKGEKTCEKETSNYYDHIFWQLRCENVLQPIIYRVTGYCASNKCSARRIKV